MTETLFLIDVIRHLPDNFNWIISNDSWEKIPHFFVDLIKNDTFHWIIFISDENKDKIIQNIINLELPEKIVHQSFVSLNGECLFKSYDHMDTIILSKDFLPFQKIIQKYSPELYILTE